MELNSVMSFQFLLFFLEIRTPFFSLCNFELILLYITKTKLIEMVH